MVRLFARHPVADFEQWFLGYNTNAALRHEGGVRADGVYQTIGDPNDVTVWHDFDTVEAAEDFVNNPKLKAVMDEIGVSGPPTIWITTEAG